MVKFLFPFSSTIIFYKNLSCPVLEIFDVYGSILFLCLFLQFFAFSRAAPLAPGGFQARGLIQAVASGLHQSHSNVGSEPRLQSTPQLTATLDPQPTEQGQGSNRQPHGS